MHLLTTTSMSFDDIVEPVERWLAEACGGSRGRVAGHYGDAV